MATIAEKVAFLRWDVPAGIIIMGVVFIDICTQSQVPWFPIQAHLREGTGHYQWTCSFQVSEQCTIAEKNIFKSIYHNDFIWARGCHVTKPHLISMSWVKHNDITKNNSCLCRVFSILLPWGGPCVSTTRAMLTLFYHTNCNIPNREHLGRWYVALKEKIQTWTGKTSD